MTEREMLEAAARAINLKLGPDSPWRTYCKEYGFQWWNEDGRACVRRWSPFTDDGDAMRLAATLRISVEHNDPGDHRPFVSAECCSSVGRVERFIEDVPDESLRADRMRLAILQCAAAQEAAKGEHAS